MSKLGEVWKLPKAPGLNGEARAHWPGEGSTPGIGTGQTEESTGDLPRSFPSPEGAGESAPVQTAWAQRAEWV